MTDYHRSPNDDDLLPIVDGEDRVVGTAPRRRVHLEGLLHRAVHIVVTDGRGRILLQHRSAEKDSYPGWWDISVGGHVDPGEEYAGAARRELEEELGIRAALEEVGRRPASAESGWEFIRVFSCRSQGPFNPPPGEISDLRWEHARDLLDHAHANPSPEQWRLTPSGLTSIRLWARNTGVRPA